MPYIFYKQTIITFHVLIHILINICHTWLLFKVFLYVLLLREKTLDLTIVYTGLTTWGLLEGTESSTRYRRYRSWNVVYLSGLWSIWNRSQNSAGHSYHCKHHGKLSSMCHYSKEKGYEVRRQTHCMQLNNNNSFRSTKYALQFIMILRFQQI